MKKDDLLKEIKERIRATVILLKRNRVPLDGTTRLAQDLKLWKACLDELQQPEGDVRERSISEFITDICDMEQFDPNHDDAIIISVDQLITAVEIHFIQTPNEQANLIRGE